MKGIKSTLMRIGVAGLMALPIAAQAAPALAKDGDVVRRGSCSGASDWKLKLSPENGRIEVEFEVDQNRSGDTWSVRMSDNGVRFFTGQRTTRPPSGSFEARDVTKNRAGADHVFARATNHRTGEVCTGRATF